MESLDDSYLSQSSRRVEWWSCGGTLRFRLLVWGKIAQVLRLRMALSFLFAGRGKASSAELGVDLGIKVHLYSPRIFEENVPRDVWSIHGEMRRRTLLGDGWSDYGELQCRILLRL